MEQIHERVAGLDVHRDGVAACVRVPGPATRRGGPRRPGTRRRRRAESLAGWLAGGGYRGRDGGDRRVLEAGLLRAGGPLRGLWLCNAHHVKNVPGRKTDMSDAEWLADVAAHGMVRPSFVPPPPIRALRELTRYRKTQTDARVRRGAASGEGAPGRRDQADLGGLQGVDSVRQADGRGAHRRPARSGGGSQPGQRQAAAEDPRADRGARRALRRAPRGRRPPHPRPLDFLDATSRH